jgi:hypothetical protein
MTSREVPYVFLFKAAGATYSKVVKQELHAFPFSPADVSGDEFVLLSKNREDCGLLEKQVQHVAKLLAVRAGTPEELDKFFPGVRAADRWNYVVELYWRKPLATPFNLSQVPGLNYKRYNTVQGFAKLDDQDALALVPYLTDTNPDVLLDFINNAERPDGR